MRRGEQDDAAGRRDRRRRAAASGRVRGNRSASPPQTGARASWTAAPSADRNPISGSASPSVAVEDRQVRERRTESREEDEVGEEDPSAGSHPAGQAIGERRRGRAGSASGSLSIRRVVPKRTASDSRAGPSTRSSSASVVAVGDRDVLGLGEGLRARAPPASSSRRSFAPTVRPPPSARGPPASARRRTGAAARSLGGQVDVARRERQAVGLADGRAGDDLGRDREVAGHPADDHHLLGVLLAEVRVLGADEVEQDRDDGRDAIEVAGSGRALERLGDRADRHDRVEARRVDLRRIAARRRCRPPSASQIAMSRASLRGYFV